MGHPWDTHETMSVMDGLLKAAAPPREIRADGPDAARVERALTDRLMNSGHSLRLLALALWPIFGLAYQGNAPWWTLACPFALHLLSITGFLWLARAYRREPELRATETWRRFYILYASLTGLAYGIGGALLLLQPYGEPRLLVAAALAAAATMAPGRFYEPRSYIVFVAGNLGPLAIGALMSGDPLALAMAVGALLFLVALLMQNAVQYRNQRDQVMLSLTHQELARRHAEAEASARAAHSSLHDTMESLPIAISVWDSDDRLVMCNQTYAQPPAAPAGSDDARRALRGVPCTQPPTSCRCHSPGPGREEHFLDGDRPPPQRRRRLGISRRSRPLGARPVAPHQVGRRRHQPGRHLRGQAARTGSDAGARRAPVGVRQHERRRAALRRGRHAGSTRTRRWRKLHDMSDELLDTLPTFADIVRYRAQRGDYGRSTSLPGGLEGWIESRVPRLHLADQPAERRRTTTGRTVEVTYRRLADKRVLTHPSRPHRYRRAGGAAEGGARQSEGARDTAERARQHDRRRDAGRSRLPLRFINRQLNDFLHLDPRSRRPGASGYDVLRYQRGVATWAPSAAKPRSRRSRRATDGDAHSRAACATSARAPVRALRRVQLPARSPTAACWRSIATSPTLEGTSRPRSIRRAPRRGARPCSTTRSGERDGRRRRSGDRTSG